MTASTFETPQLPSIRQRLVRALVAASVLWVLVVSATAWLTIRHQVNELADAGLQESGELLYGLMATLEQPLQATRPAAPLPAPAHQEKVIWQRVGPDGQVVLRSHHAPATAFFSQPTLGLAQAGGLWRVYGLPLPHEQGVLYVADRLTERRAAYADAAWEVLAVTLLLGAVFLLGSRVLVRRELYPLQLLSDAVSAHDPSQTGTPLPQAQREELAPIHKAVVELGHRLTRRIANERAFSAHAAHALRTPLAGMDAQLAVALRECGPAVRPRLEQTRAATNRLKRVVASLLTLFRSGIETRWQTVDIATLLEKVAIDGLAIRTVPPVEVEADPDLLVAALINLLDNVVRHGGSRVSLEVQVDTRFQVITLTDNGPGIQAERLAELQAALAAQNYAGHMGLGLMMADMVARAHGGTLQIANREVGMAAEMTLRRMPKP
jgi:two-component system OmpR family sensor kinase